jgi:hypothetical protein
MPQARFLERSAAAVMRWGHDCSLSLVFVKRIRACDETILSSATCGLPSVYHSREKMDEIASPANTVQSRRVSFTRSPFDHTCRREEGTGVRSAPGSKGPRVFPREEIAHTERAH